MNNIILQYTPVNIKDSMKQLMLLHFDDDTFKIVISITDEMMHIVNFWYEECNIFFNMEKIDAMINVNTEGLYEKILFTTNDIFIKETFINNYIPAVIQMAEFLKNIEDIEMEKLKLSQTNIICSKKCLKRNLTLDELNIIVPDKLKHNPYYYHKNNNVITFLQPDTFTDITAEFELKVQEQCIFYNTKSTTIHNLQFYEKGIIDKEIDKEIDKVKKEKIVPYNDDYDALNPAFGMNCFNLDTTPTNLSMCSLLIIIFNPKNFMTIVVTNPDIVTFDLIKNHSEFGFIEIFSASVKNEHIKTTIQKQYHKTIFNNIDELNNMMIITIQCMELLQINQNKKDEYAEERVSIINYLKNNYYFTTEINNKMKASVIANKIIEYSGYKFDKNNMLGFKNRLPQYLKELGLQKKRYNDGYYYYGISSMWDDNTMTLKTFVEGVSLHNVVKMV
jgi:hypothetical protein